MMTVSQKRFAKGSASYELLLEAFIDARDAWDTGDIDLIADSRRRFREIQNQLIPSPVHRSRI